MAWKSSMTISRFIYLKRTKENIEKYTQGECYTFYKILKNRFPSALPFYDCNHVITKIGRRYYDITGIVKRKRHLLMTTEKAIVNFFEVKSNGG